MRKEEEDKDDKNIDNTNVHLRMSTEVTAALKKCGGCVVLRFCPAKKRNTYTRASIKSMLRFDSSFPPPFRSACVACVYVF